MLTQLIDLKCYSINALFLVMVLVCRWSGCIVYCGRMNLSSTMLLDLYISGDLLFFWSCDLKCRCNVPNIPSTYEDDAIGYKGVGYLFVYFMEDD